MTLALIYLGFLSNSVQVPGVTKSATGVEIKEQTGVLRIDAVAPRVFRVRFSKSGLFPAPRIPTIVAQDPPPAFKVSSDDRTVTLATADIKAVIDRATGSVHYCDKSGKPFLSEILGSRRLTATDSKDVYLSELAFRLAAQEGIFGLGQHQDGLLDHLGSVVTLEQQNREVAIPFAVSSKGYGLLWNNPAATTVSVAVRQQPLDPQETFGDDGQPGGLTGHYFRGRNFETPAFARTDRNIDFEWSHTPPPGLPHDNYSVRWTGSFLPAKGGEFAFKTIADDGVRLWIDGTKIIDDWSTHAPQLDLGKINLTGGIRHQVRLEYFQAGGGASVNLTEMIPDSGLRWCSEASEGIDYYVFYGPSIDRVMAEYRHTTGEAPMPPKWALGYWQSKERYATQAEWGEVAAEYRRRRHPIDVLVQDWFYWDPHPWGSHLFDSSRYSDPAAGVDELHRDHLHAVISVWGKFAPGTPSNPDKNYDELNAGEYLLPKSLSDESYYDAFNPDARRLYWRQIYEGLYSKGFDGWWLDASEPEVNMRAFRRTQTAAGPGALVLNAWPLMHTIGISQGQLASAPDKRVVILTRSAYAGQQRSGAITWSGDITATWKVLSDQVPAGLNFCLSGIPYWTTDIGAFFAPHELYPLGASDPAYRELFTRWFQYGSFCPIFRVHGTNFAKEMWQFGPQTEEILDRFDRLRYRLMPYIYSQAWQVSAHSSTLMRALVMDFPDDVEARERADEFMFGPSLLIAPVTQPGVTSRRVYLPRNPGGWFDFWTNIHWQGGQDVTAAATIDKIPIFVRAGAILPLGPDIQYTTEKPANPIDLHLFPGSSSHFTLYEDENDNNGYRHGRRAEIPISWDGKTRRLTIGKRIGQFPGMLGKRQFHALVVGAPRATEATILYNGRAQSIRIGG